MEWEDQGHWIWLTLQPRDTIGVHRHLNLGICAFLTNLPTRAHSDMTRKMFGNPVLRKYQQYGLFGGLVLGTLVGVLSGGPHFHEWSAGQSLAVVCAFALGAAVFGCFGVPLVMGAMTSGAPVIHVDADAEDSGGDNNALERGGDGNAGG